VLKLAVGLKKFVAVFDGRDCYDRSLFYLHKPYLRQNNVGRRVLAGQIMIAIEGTCNSPKSTGDVLRSNSDHDIVKGVRTKI
jgi:hypothetical protein